MPEHTPPLEGLRVLDVSTILAGPLCCQILGDFGADVIKVEHPRSGDNMRGHGHSKDGVPLWWKEISRNKRTRRPRPQGRPRRRGLPAPRRARADVVVENFRPGTLERWGIGPDVLQEANPGLVVVRLTGFGQTGPYSTRAGLRHARRGDERLRRPRPARPTVRRRCPRSVWPTASAASLPPRRC